LDSNTGSDLKGGDRQIEIEAATLKGSSGFTVDAQSILWITIIIKTLQEAGEVDDPSIGCVVGTSQFDRSEDSFSVYTSQFNATECEGDFVSLLIRKLPTLIGDAGLPTGGSKADALNNTIQQDTNLCSRAGIRICIGVVAGSSTPVITPSETSSSCQHKDCRSPSGNTGNSSCLKAALCLSRALLLVRSTIHRDRFSTVQQEQKAQAKQ
jgi:hypothetical protein